jgi:hypothetical protein
MGSEKTDVGSEVTYMKGLKSRLLTYLIRVLGPSPSGISYTIERAEITAKDNKYQLIDLLCVDLFIWDRGYIKN